MKIITSFLCFLCITLACTSKHQQEASWQSARDSASLEVSKPSSIFKSIKTEKKLDTKLFMETSSLVNRSENLKALLEKAKSGDSLRIVCYGNSITNGFSVGSFGEVDHPYPQVLQKLLRARFAQENIYVINQGHNGWRSDQGLHQLPSLVLAASPDLVILMFGINDAYSGFSSERYGQYMQEMVKTLRENDIEVLLLTPTPISTNFNKNVLNYHAILEQIADNQKISVFNLYRAIVDRAAQESIAWAKILPDQVHFGDQYYAWIAEAIDHFFETLLDNEK